MSIFLTIIVTTSSLATITCFSRYVYNKYFKPKPRRAALINYHDETSYPPYVNL